MRSGQKSAIKVPGAAVRANNPGYISLELKGIGLANAP